MTMFYGSCTVACPALIDDVKRTVAELGDVRVVLVSFDAARDTPDKLAELARIHDLDARWTLAAADDSDARELAATIGYKYRKLDSGEFFHGATIVALDATGRVIARSEGFNNRGPLLAALR
jgi:protein SCO1